MTDGPKPLTQPHRHSTRMILRFGFESAHRLPYHDGKCQFLHGHSYKLEVTLWGKIIPDDPLDSESGMVADFGNIKPLIRDSIIPDHRDLNEILPNPTAELLAHWLFEEIRAKLREYVPGVNLIGVRLWETDTASIEVRANERAH